MQNKVKSQITLRAVACLTGQVFAYLHLGSTVWITGQFLTVTESILPGAILLWFLALGLFLSKRILLVAETWIVYFIGALVASLSFYLFDSSESLLNYTIFSALMGLSSGIAFYAPILQSQLHLPDRTVLISTIVLVATSIGFSICCMMPAWAVSWFYFICVFLATILMTEPQAGLYKPQVLERLRILMLKNQSLNDPYILKSQQLINLTLVLALTQVLPICFLLGFQRLLSGDTSYAKAIASIWMLLNLASRILARYVALLGDKRLILLVMLLMQYLVLMLYRYEFVEEVAVSMISALSAGFVQTFIPLMTIDIFKQHWLYEQITYPLSLMIASAIACSLLHFGQSSVYLWCMLTQSCAFAVLTIGNYTRYIAPVQIKVSSVLDE